MEPYVFHLDLASFSPWHQPLAVSWQSSSQNVDIWLGLNNILMSSSFGRANRILELQFLKVPYSIFSLSGTGHRDLRSPP